MTSKLHYERALYLILALGERSQLQRFFSALGVKSKSTGQEREDKGNELMVRRWGPPGSPHYEIVMRYWSATRMQEHWNYLRTHDLDVLRKT